MGTKADKVSRQHRYDVAVIGAGPGGSAAAIEAARCGLDVVVIEKDEFPRFHVGESLTGEASRLVRDWGCEDLVTQGKHVSKDGTYVFGGADAGFYVPVMGVGADGTSRIPQTTWQVTRADFDQALLTAAQRHGATVISGTAASALTDSAGAVCGVRVSTDAGEQDVRARFTIDASGRARFMSKQGLAGPTARGGSDKQIAFFTHLKGVDRSDEKLGTNTQIFYAGDYRWSWLIPVDDCLTSIGIVVPSRYFRSKDELPGEFVRREMNDLHPKLADVTRDATIERAVESAHNFSYQVSDFSGPGWLAVGDAHRFVDPIFSLGVACAMLEGSEAGKRCKAAIDRNLSSDEAYTQLLKPFEKWADAGLDVVEDLITGFWNNPFGFGYLVHKKYRKEMVDMFAGRFYTAEAQATKGRLALRRLAEAAA